MRIKQLECFIDLCHTTSLTKTAKNMHMAIPSLSESIDRMESEVGCNLFEKTSKGYFLNKMGEMFYNDIKGLVVQYQTALNRLEGFSIDKTVKFGIDPSIYPGFLSRILAKHQAECQQETLEVISCNFKDFKLALLKNQIDICYCYKYHPFPKQLEFVPLFENNICVLLSKNNPLFNKPSIKVDDLIDQTIYYDIAYETTGTKKIINYLSAKNATIKNFNSPDNPISMLEVELHNGIMIMHQDKKDIYTANMTLSPINGLSETFGLVYLKDDGPQLKSIIQAMKAHF